MDLKYVPVVEEKHCVTMAHSSVEFHTIFSRRSCGKKFHNKYWISFVLRTKSLPLLIANRSRAKMPLAFSFLFIFLFDREDHNRYTKFINTSLIHNEARTDVFQSSTRLTRCAINLQTSTAYYYRPEVAGRQCFHRPVSVHRGIPSHMAIIHDALDLTLPTRHPPHSPGTGPGYLPTSPADMEPGRLPTSTDI